MPGFKFAMLLVALFLDGFLFGAKLDAHNYVMAAVWLAVGVFVGFQLYFSRVTIPRIP